MWTCFSPLPIGNRRNLTDVLAHPGLEFSTGPPPQSTVGWITTFRLPRGKNTVILVSAVWPWASSITVLGFIPLLVGVKGVGLSVLSAFKFSDFMKAKPGNWPPNHSFSLGFALFLGGPSKVSLVGKITLLYKPLWFSNCVLRTLGIAVGETDHVSALYAWVLGKLTCVTGIPLFTNLQIGASYSFQDSLFPERVSPK